MQLGLNPEPVLPVTALGSNSEFRPLILRSVSQGDNLLAYSQVNIPWYIRASLPRHFNEQRVSFGESRKLYSSS